MDEARRKALEAAGFGVGTVREFLGLTDAEAAPVEMRVNRRIEENKLMPRTHMFTLTLAGVSEIADEVQGKLLAVGCDDASLWSEGETLYLDFSRDAESLGAAVGSAIAAIERAGFAVEGINIEPPPGPGPSLGEEMLAGMREVNDAIE